MSRPENDRIVHQPPIYSNFKPLGIPGRTLKQISVSLDEFEAIRLADHIGLSHEEASNEMEISRPTFSRLIERARKKIAEFIVSGKMLTIGGGKIHFKNNIIQCLDCGHMFKTSIDMSLSECPECKSIHLLNLAGGFGHGKCCLNISN